ncbi:hypothetical protein GE21DRAFT_1330422 [Neurospora crassa]|uniref:Anchored cell wall protein 11 n=2 Tax=Neurospora crassa TaxID=5141 RepID=Q7SF37_NEUCR|nr:anchored cell wall protein 11 [Neurospora crassa OR74A]EAA35427.1 anchored cell wall protein 11 [Neurospora crassa OR74A]KHE89115.1 hypothetical protein GE21DRAFT_1330422 [Neurospora crassa]CAE76216.1 putative protein [Neurospora crassa]|eukprot:XP_964663.1 anchored cell wall protein 11 [Neurospora crassa OR74A]
MRQNIIFVALSALTAAVAAQSSNSNLTVPVDSVNPTLRNQWCVAQYNTCKILCGMSVSKNDCDPTTLEWSCTCSSGVSPAVEEYEQTVPFLMCEFAFDTCIANHPNDSQGQDKCETDIRDKCATKPPAAIKVSSSSAAATTSAAKPTQTKDTAVETSAAPASSTSESFAAPTNAAAFLGNGVAAAAAGVFAAALL